MGVDASGSRVGPWVYSAKKLLIVAGTNKIVEDLAESEKRVQFQYLMESARCLVAYGHWGSNITNHGAVIHATLATHALIAHVLHSRLEDPESFCARSHPRPLDRGGPWLLTRSQTFPGSRTPAASYYILPVTICFQINNWD